MEVNFIINLLKSTKVAKVSQQKTIGPLPQKIFFIGSHPQVINYVSTSVAAFFQQHYSFFLRDFITLLPRAGPCSPQRSRVSCARPASSPWRPQWPRPAYQLDILPCRTSPSIKLLRKKATLPPLVLILASSLLLISLAERRSAPPLLTCCSKSTSY